MEILDYHRYTMIMKAGGYERVGCCINPRVRELSLEESSYYQATIGIKAKAPTHEMAFRDTENLRIYIGWIKEDSEEKLVFDLGEGKEYEFRPIVAPSR